MEEYEMWLASCNISNESKIALIKKYNNEKSIYNNIDDIDNIYILKANEYQRLKETKLDRGIELFKKLADNNISYITIKSKEYPSKLKNIYNPPYILYYKGNLKLVEEYNVAIVGSRKSTLSGNEVTKIISKEIAFMKLGVISGGAYGIDTIAHREVLRCNGNTIAVFGCGIDICYPKTNSNLYKEMEKKGLLLSEFLPGTQPLKYNFPMRNRIISGLSEKVIVVEASLKSGSLITVGYALDQGKDVMAVPGSVLNECSIGCNRLLRDGATPFTGIEDLYDFLGITKSKNEKAEENTMKSYLLRVISNEPIHLDKIINNVNIDRVLLYELLFEMQKGNEIICLPGNYYARLS